jgi:hypothetical protein
LALGEGVGGEGGGQPFFFGRFCAVAKVAIIHWKDLVKFGYKLKIGK